MKRLIGFISVALTFAACVPIERTSAPFLQIHEPGQTLFTVVVSREGVIEKILDLNKAPISDERIVPRERHDHFIKELQRRNPDSVEIIRFKRLIDSILFEDGESQIQVGLDRNGDVTEILTSVSKDRAILSGNYDTRTEQLREDNSRSFDVVKVIDPVDELIFYEGSHCHSAGSNGFVYKDCSSHTH